MNTETEHIYSDFKPEHFALYELLPPEMYKDEDTGWCYLDTRLLTTLETVRKIIGKPLICNTWYQNGNRRNCGFRLRNCSVGSPRSQHKDGKAVDLLCASYTAEQMRQIIKHNADKLPYRIRIEDGVDWLHIDLKEHSKEGKIYFFKHRK